MNSEKFSTEDRIYPRRTKESITFKKIVSSHRWLLLEIGKPHQHAMLDQHVLPSFSLAGKLVSQNVPLQMQTFHRIPRPGSGIARSVGGIA